MVYTPPDIDNVDFELDAYTSSSPDNVDFDLTDARSFSESLNIAWIVSEREEASVSYFRTLPENVAAIYTFATILMALMVLTEIVRSIDDILTEARFFFSESLSQVIGFIDDSRRFGSLERSSSEILTVHERTTLETGKVQAEYIAPVLERAFSITTNIEETIAFIIRVRRGMFTRLNQTLGVIHTRASRVEYLREASELVATNTIFDFLYSQFITEISGIIDERINNLSKFQTSVVGVVEDRSLKPVQFFKENIGAKTEFLKTPGKIVSEPIGVLLDKAYGMTLIRTETIGIREDFVFLYNQVIIELVGGLETVQNVGVVKVLSEETGIVSLRSMLPTRTFEEVVGVLYQTPLQAKKFLESNVGVLGVADRVADYTRTAAEVVGVVEVYDFIYNHVIVEVVGGIETVQDVGVTKVLSQTIPTVDTRANVVTRIREEVVGVRTTFNRFAEYIRTAEEIIGVREVYDFFYNQVIVEVVGGIETVQDVGVVKILSEKAGIVIDRSILIKSPREELIGILEIPDTTTDYFRTATEVVGIREEFDFLYNQVIIELVGGIETVQDINVVKILSERGGVIIDRSVAITHPREEIVGVVYETPYIVSKRVQSIVGVLGVANKVADYFRTATEVVGIIQRFDFLYNQVIIELVGGIETVQDIVVIKNLKESVGIVQKRSMAPLVLFEEFIVVSYVTTFVVFKNLQETIANLSVVDRVVNYSRSVLELVGVVEEFDFLYNQIIVELVGGIETVQDVNIIKILSKEIGIDTDRSMAIKRAREEIVGNVYETSYLVSKRLQSTVGVLDVVDTVVDYFRTVIEVVGVIEKFDYIYNQIIAELIGGIETVQDVVVVKGLKENVSISQNLSVGPILSPEEVISVVYDVPRRASKSLQDPIGISDVLDRIGDYTRSFSEVVGIVENVESSVDFVKEQALAVIVGVSDRTSFGVVKTLSEKSSIVTDRSMAVTLPREELVAFVYETPLSISKRVQESAGIITAFVRETYYIRTATEVVGIVEEFDFLYNQIIIEVSGGIETVQDMGIIKGLTERISVVQTRSLRPMVAREAVVSVTYHALHRVSKRLQEVVGVLNVADTVADYFRTATEVVGIIDKFDFLYNQVIIEISGGIESVQDVGVVKSLTQVSGISDRQTLTISNIREVVVGIFDESSFLQKVTRSLQEMVSITEDRAFGVSKSNLSVVGTEDLLVKSVTFSAEEVVGIIDEYVLKSIVPVQETVSQQIDRTLGSRKSLEETIALLDLSESVRVVFVRISEAFQVSSKRRMAATKNLRQEISTFSLINLRKEAIVILSETVAVIDSLRIPFGKTIRRVSAVGANFIAVVSRAFTELSLFNRLNEVTIQQTFNQTMIFERARYAETKNIENEADTFDPRNNVETFDEYNQS